MTRPSRGTLYSRTNAKKPAPEPEKPASKPREPQRESRRWGYSPRELGPHPPEGQRDILDERLSDLSTQPNVEKLEPIGFAHNGFHVDDEQGFQPLPPPAPERARPSRHERSARHYLPEEPEKRSFWFESNGRHSRDDPDDASRYGRHSMPGRD